MTQLLLVGSGEEMVGVSVKPHIAVQTRRVETPPYRRTRRTAVPRISGTRMGVSRTKYGRNLRVKTCSRIRSNADSADVFMNCHDSRQRQRFHQSTLHYDFHHRYCGGQSLGKVRNALGLVVFYGRCGLVPRFFQKRKTPLTKPLCRM